MFDEFFLFLIVFKKLCYLFILVCSLKIINIQWLFCCFCMIGNNGYLNVKYVKNIEKKMKMLFILNMNFIIYDSL